MALPSASYLPFLCSKQRLERDKGLEIIKEILKNPSSDEILSLEQNIVKLLPITEEGEWEGIHGGLMACALMLEAGVGSDELCKQIQEVAPQMLEHQEPRVRLSTGEKYFKTSSLQDFTESTINEYHYYIHKL